MAIFFTFFCFLQILYFLDFYLLSLLFYLNKNALTEVSAQKNANSDCCHTNLINYGITIIIWWNLLFSNSKMIMAKRYSYHIKQKNASVFIKNTCILNFRRYLTRYGKKESRRNCGFPFNSILSAFLQGEESFQAMLSFLPL